MAGTAGKASRLSVATTLGGSYTVPAGLKNISFEINGAALDDSEFGVNWEQKIQGLKSFKITASGSFRVSDTNGQIAIRSSLISDTDLFAKVLPDGTNGFKGQVIVTKFATDPAVDGIVPVSIEMEGSGALTAVP